MLRGILLILAMTALPVWSDDFAFRRSPSSLSRNAQDRQFLQQQAQMVQGSLRAEEARMLNRQSYVQLLPAQSGLDLIRRDEPARSTLAGHYREELDRLASRYRELEEEGRRLRQTRSLRAQQRNED